MDLPGFQEFEFPARECPDWAYARTPRAAILVPAAEWVQSVYSCEFELNGRWLLTPNRDYPYEGLLVHTHGENWKFIDCIAVNLRSRDGRPVRLRRDDPRTCVRVSPWSATYWYALEEMDTSDSPVAPRLFVRYLLDAPADSESLTGRIEIGFENPWHGMARDIELVVQPFLDVRHMFAAAEFEKYSIDVAEGSEPAARVRVYNRAITFHFPKGDLTRFGNLERLDWWYKLGTGQRVEEWDAFKSQSRTTFTGEHKQVAAFFHFRPALSEDAPVVTLRFTCELELQRRTALTPPDYLSIQSASERRNADLWRQAWSLCTLEASPEVRAAAAARVVCFANLRIFAGPPDSRQFWSVPPAGGWWFRTPWFRDIFEGLLTGFHTAMRLESERSSVWHAVELALANQDRKSRLVPNRVPEFNESQPTYDGSDATLLCLIAGLRYAMETRDRRIAMRMMRACARAINRFRKAYAFTPPSPGGGPRLCTDTGLLLTCPQHSWIDTRNQEVTCGGDQMKGIPNRASPAFVTDMYDAVRDSRRVEWLLSSPRFFMPEINAQWILTLRSLRENLVLVRPTAAERRTPTYSALSNLIERAESSCSAARMVA
jgi:Amylo-alpha-1,6-glucosidase